ncbi:MAG: hypothetical protein ACETWR_13850 [Anaerolineae bacterium]
MKRKLFVITLTVLLALLLGVSGTTAQDPDVEGELQSEGEISAAATLNSRISYQGVLKEDGEPVTGSRNMTFGLYSDGSCTTLVRSIGTWSVTVTDGLFSETLDVTHSDFNGQGLWLGVTVESTPVDCLEILPAPYALSLRPGADVFGTADGDSVIYAHNMATTGDSYGLRGRSDSNDGRGVYGYASANSGTTYGVYGRSDSSTGRGVYGYAFSLTGTASGVMGSSNSSTGGRGVYGRATSLSGDTYGVYGSSWSTTGGTGVYGTAHFTGTVGVATETSGITHGVYGRSDSSTDTAGGVYGYASAVSGTTYGVYGVSESSVGIGVVGYAETLGVFGVGDSIGAAGAVNATSGTTYGVQGQVASSSGRGVYGYASATSGTTYGVYGKSDSTDEGRGVYGEAPKYGVHGKATATSGTTYGVYGYSSSWGSYGVYGKSANATNSTGVYGEGAFRGVHGKSTGTLGDDAGVYGEGYYGVHGEGTNHGVHGYCDGCTGVYAEGYTGVDASGSTGVRASGNTYGVDASAASGTAVYGYGSSHGVHGETWSSSGYGVEAENTSNGVALIARSGTTGNPIEAWRGSSERVFRVEALTGDVYADGGYHCGNDDGGSSSLYIDENFGCMHDLSPADFAEVMPIVSDPEPGDVLAVRPDGQLTASTEPYQSTVVGVYSARPSYVGGAANLGKDGYAPLAVVGLVPVKASAENGSIQPGDLLVSSSMPGHAMKASPSPPVGTVVGKALEGLDEGTGVIQILVMLQ